jgi:dTDP-4-amino-4,6-dideoxygalactose transaminase
MEARREIPFCIPDVGEEEAAAVAAVIRSHWITSGAECAAFENEIAAFLGADHAVCLNSATAGLELALRAFGIGPGDEVVTTPYTYAATANVILHCGAVPVLADLVPGGFAIDPQAVERVIGPRTKAVIPVDFAGLPCDYAALSAVVEAARPVFRAAHPRQAALGRPLLLADAAHAFGSSYAGKRLPDGLDAAVYSFHAVKNLTTAEGGAIAFRSQPGVLDGGTARWLALAALHGQDRDALAKTVGGGWEYDILFPGYKCNLTDLVAVLGRCQLRRYPAQLTARRALAALYDGAFAGDDRVLLPPGNDAMRSGSDHLYPLRLAAPDSGRRAALIAAMAGCGVRLNVHFKPLPLLTAYRERFRAADYPHAMRAWESEISLPIYPALAAADAAWLAAKLRALL